jgi:hypothetical protein
MYMPYKPLEYVLILMIEPENVLTGTFIDKISMMIPAGICRELIDNPWHCGRYIFEHLPAAEDLGLGHDKSVILGTQFFLRGGQLFICQTQFIFRLDPFGDVDGDPQHGLLVAANGGIGHFGGLKDAVISECVNKRLLRDTFGRARRHDFAVVIKHVPEFGSVPMEPRLGFSLKLGDARIVTLGERPVCEQKIPVPVIHEDHVGDQIDNLPEMCLVLFQRFLRPPAHNSIPDLV